MGIILNILCQNEDHPRQILQKWRQKRYLNLIIKMKDQKSTLGKEEKSEILGTYKRTKII